MIVLGRYSPGVPPLHDILRAEIIIQTEIGTLRLETTIAPRDVDDWESAMNALAADEPVSWLGHRCPGIEIGPGGGNEPCPHRRTSRAQIIDHPRLTKKIRGSLPAQLPKSPVPKDR